MQRSKVRRIGKKVARHQTIAIKDVHVFVDYLLNQKDGKSFVLLPDLIAPHPFLFGTLCRNEAAVNGPDTQGFYRLKVDGLILPGTLRTILEGFQLEFGAGAILGVSSVPEGRTESLAVLPLEQG